ncbi:MAG: hypothetical protein KJ600_02845 [Nanoarchaeota archaeon]|nr:hypothetical protein [Nanoarchaeota archaeon]MBU1103467.1 hypothetical protein [Nanoarchaeota archaeon]MBU1988167.1 hypothetical protein [Nanoarchaeota archaeon]
MQQLLRYQNNSGLFPTIGKKKELERSLESIFLHTFVLEYLLDHHSEEGAGAIQKGLDALVSHAVSEEETYMWQWLKNPPGKGDHRPPDTDDTMRARLIIEKALRGGFSVPKEFKNFDYDAFLNPLMTEDGSIRTYVRDRHSESCPIVNTNILYALTSIGGHDQIRIRIKESLEQTAESVSFDPDIFSEQSKYFISPLFPTYVLSKIIKADPDFFSTDEEERVVKYCKKISPRNVVEEAWKSSILRNCGQQENLLAEASYDNIPIFQAKSLGEVYGSPSATAIFCLEAKS